MTKNVAHMRLEQHTKYGSDIRALGERLIAGSITTGAIARMFPCRPSIFSEIRRTLRGKCWGDKLVATKIKGDTPQYTYTLLLREG